MNIKPSPEQVREWDIASIAYADETTDQYPCWEDARNMGFAELAAQWGAEQAIKGQAPVEEPELPEAFEVFAEDEPHGIITGFTATQMHDHFQAGVLAGMAQSQDAKLEPLVREALRKAFSFGQRYWQQADSEYASDHKKSNETQLKFLALIEETIAAMQGDSQ